MQNIILRKCKRQKIVRTRKLQTEFYKTAGSSNGVIVNNKLSFEEWFIDDEFPSKNVTVLEESKAFIHDLINKTDFVPKMIDVEIVQNDHHFHFCFLSLCLLNNIKMLDFGPPNEDTLKKEEKEIDTLLKNNKCKNIEESDDEYEENKDKKIKFNEDSVDDDVTFVHNRPVHPRDRVKKVNPDVLFVTKYPSILLT